MLTAIREAVAGGSPAKLQLAAHTLKGVIRYFASSQGFQQVQRLENLGQDKNLEGAEGICHPPKPRCGCLLPLFQNICKRRTFMTNVLVVVDPLAVCAALVA